MIPIRLEIEGLYSYREKQIIEFETLTAAGLFGIFGAVGSGKSAILEGILIALYGNPERVSNSGERGSMINLQHPQVVLNFTFKSGPNNSNIYLARYSVKRNKKDFEKIETAAHTFYEQVNNEWEATEKSAAELIGMSRENFKQTIIIPQGKFREFIDQKPTERAQMMQDLFGLDRFDLSAQTGSLVKQAREEKIRLETQLKGLEEITSESLQSKQVEFATLSEAHLHAGQLLAKQLGTLTKMDGVRKSFLELQNLKQGQAGLASRLPEMEEKRKLYRSFLSAKTYLRPIWDRITDLEMDLEKYQVSLKECLESKQSFETEIQTLVADEKKFRELNELRPQREGKIRDLRKVLEIQDLTSKKALAQQELDTLAPALAQKTKEIQSLEKEIESLEAKKAALPISDPKLLVELKTSQHQLQELQKRRGEVALALQESAGQLTKSITQLASYTSHLPEGVKSLEDWLELQKSEVKKLEAIRENLIRTQGLATHAHLLENGMPCPMCGASEHPNPLQSGEAAKALLQAETDLKQASHALEEIRELLQRKGLEEAQLSNVQKNQEQKLRENEILQNQEQEIWGQLKILELADQEQLRKRIDVLEHAFQSTETIQQQLNTLRKTSAELRGGLEEATQKLQEAKLNLQDFLSRIKSKEQEIKDLDFCNPYFEKSISAILGEIARVEENIETAATSLVGIQKHLQKRQIDQSKNLADLQNFQSLVLLTQKRLASSHEEFAEMMATHGFQEKEELIRLFQQDLDAEKMDTELRSFDQQVATTNARIEALQTEEGLADYSEERFQALQEEVATAKDREKGLQTQVTLLNQELQEISRKLQEKQVLADAFEKLDIRETNLKELERLFSGKGFVRYVSSIYLRELCNTANKRFRILTKNSLSLEIDDSNTFWVTDYLNGGKKRLLKTLSGGQTFQASLCLALALAEKVKALNQADQSFFFLDEGFGALDKNSLRVVFETLKALRHENRVVGIISHVEELQQEVGVYVQVELDAELGSAVSYSF
ncbi:MAG: SMC family ATPase [Algoriphagus sp.]|nr:SMC family ATPase [Algoriphagus sp.]MCE2778037.1 SMC family ATPase [Algoriphagus sp.]